MTLKKDFSEPADAFSTCDSDISDPLESVTVVVCSSCRRPGDPDDKPRPGSRLAENAAEAGAEAGVRVRQVACLGNCKRGLSASLLREGCWSYVFGELQPDSGEDLIAGAKLFARSADGFIPFRDRPQALKRGLIARIPTYDSLKEIP